MQEIRCTKCSKLLYKIHEPEIRKHGNYVEVPDAYEIVQPKIEIKCPRCGEKNTKKESVENECNKD